MTDHLPSLSAHVAEDAAGSVLRLRQPANRVSPRAVTFWTVRALLGWVVIAGVQVAILIFTDTASHRAVNFAVLAGTVVLAAAHLSVMPRWRFRVHRWELTPTACYAQSGWINQQRRIAPLSRIQTVDSERGPLEQLFKLANVTVTTASAAGPIKIKGLDRGTADQLIDDLTTITSTSTGDAT
ncbi:PH domain-containing protein [Jatrophihabitans sp. DSM 45814]